MICLFKTGSTRTRSYVLFADFKIQNYFNCINIEKFRIAMTRLRVFHIDLQIDIYLYRAIPLDDRKFKNCSILEDEFHFILECRLYTKLHTKYIKKYYQKRPNIPKFIELFNTENENEIRNLSMYIFKAFNIRNTILYD